MAIFQLDSLKQKKTMEILFKNLLIKSYMFEIKNYFETSSLIIKSLAKHEIEIDKICKEILDCDNNNNKILVAGNGGSCSDCEHFVGELQCTFKKRNRKPFSAISYLVYLQQ